MTDVTVDLRTGAITYSGDPIPPTPAMVKREAMRRILAIAPEWKQRNLTAQAVLLQHKGVASWTGDETAAWAAGEALWARIAAIRAASDTIEAMAPIPADYADDSHWPEAMP